MAKLPLYLQDHPARLAAIAAQAKTFTTIVGPKDVEAVIEDCRRMLTAYGIEPEPEPVEPVHVKLVEADEPVTKTVHVKLVEASHPAKSARLIVWNFA